MVFDITLRGALRHLANGDGEPLADLIESGYTKNLHEALQHDPLAREKLAKAVRTGKPLKPRERPWESERLDKRSWWLCGRVAYWIGRGMDDHWQDSKNVSGGGTVWHYAVAEWPEEPGVGWVDAPRPAVSSLQKTWQKTLRDPDAFRLMHMTHQFCHGVEHEVVDVHDPAEFLSQQWCKAKGLGLMPEIYTAHLMPLWARI